MTRDDPASYGDLFADVYDDWYASVSDVTATVAAVAAMAGGHPVLELGVGTGRVALPLAEAGVEVHGIDASEAMIERLLAKRGSERIRVLVGDMAELSGVPAGPTYGVVFAAFNTFFNLTTDAAQRRCLRRAAASLRSDGVVAIEAFVPTAEPTGPEEGDVVRFDGAGGTIVTSTHRDPVTQIITGLHLHTTAEGIVTERPWKIHYLHPAQLDELCAQVGLTLQARWADWAGTSFGSEHDRHVSVYRIEP